MSKYSLATGPTNEEYLCKKWSGLFFVLGLNIGFIIAYLGSHGGFRFSHKDTYTHTPFFPISKHVTITKSTNNQSDYDCFCKFVVFLYSLQHHLKHTQSSSDTHKHNKKKTKNAQNITKLKQQTTK